MVDGARTAEFIKLSFQEHDAFNGVPRYNQSVFSFYSFLIYRSRFGQKSFRELLSDEICACDIYVVVYGASDIGFTHRYELTLKLLDESYFTTKVICKTAATGVNSSHKPSGTDVLHVEVCGFVLRVPLSLECRSELLHRLVETGIFITGKPCRLCRVCCLIRLPCTYHRLS